MADELSDSNESGPYDSYLKTLASWPTSVASSSHWFLQFDIAGIPALFDSVTERLNNFEGNFGKHSGWDITDDTILKLTDWELNLKNRIGCVLARQVNLPSDSFDAGNTGVDFAGWGAPATANTRSKYNKLKITFLETNASFVDFVIKPWLVLASYNGLMSRQYDSYRNVKCAWCDVNLLAKIGAGKRQALRKTYRFNNIVPVSIDGEQYSYMSDDMKYTSVDFVYDQYYIRDTHTPLYLNNTRISDPN
jgi:hypothetical protein